MQLKKYLPILAVFLSTAPLSAQYYSDNDCYSQFCDPCNGWYLQGELLYWKIRRSGLDYAIDSYDIESDPGERRPDGDIHCVEPCYDIGARVHLSKECRDVYIAFMWTNLDIDASHHITSEGGSPVILPTRLHPSVSGFDTADDARGDFNYCQNQFDVEFGVCYRFNQCQKILPYVGLRYTRLDQQFDSTALVTQSGYRTDNFQRMDAFAMTCGTKGVAKYCDCFELFINVGGALHLADFDTKQELFTITDGLIFNTDPELYASKKECLWVVNLDLSMGMGFDVCKTACGEISLFLGYEFHKWLCMPDFLNFTDNFRTAAMSRNQANLAYDGLFAGIRASF